MRYSHAYDQSSEISYIFLQFFAVIQVAYNGYLLIAVQVNLASEKTPTEHAQVIIQEVY